MSVDVRDLSGANVKCLTKLLSRRPEYGIAMPSRRWLSRQDEKLKTLPSELLRTSNLLKRLVIKIADKIDPSVIDPRAVLCKTHASLNPFLIRRLFLAVAYEVTVHTDLLRSWKDRKDYPIISAFVGRVDAIAALWTEPELYKKCYGMAPFESHMVCVRSGCEACILSAVGANARVLADLRTILIDRVERRLPRPDGRSAKEPRLARFVDGWIDHLGEERAGRCRELSDHVLTELRATRPQVSQWRSRRKKEIGRSRSKRPIYKELRITGSTPQLSSIPNTSGHRRRTRNGIPVAMVDKEGAEEQRRMAMFSMTKEAEGAKSIFRPDSMCDYSQLGPPRMTAYDPTHSIIGGRQSAPPLSRESSGEFSKRSKTYEDYEEVDEEANFARNLEEEEESRSKVTDWYATRLAECQADLSPDDARSVLSSVHPAFQPPKTFSHISATPTPLRLKKNQPPPSAGLADSQSAWTDVTARTCNTNAGYDAPPVPRVPSTYNGESSGHNNNNNNNNNNSNSNNLRRTSSIRTPRPRSAISNRPQSQSYRAYTSSSIYSDQPPPSSIPPFESRNRRTSGRGSAPPRQSVRRFAFDDPLECGSRGSTSARSQSQREYMKKYRPIRDFAREDNPFTSGNARTESGATSSSSSSRYASRVPPMTASVSSPSSYTGADGSIVVIRDVSEDFGPPTPGPNDRQEWDFPIVGDGAYDELDDSASLMPDDSLSAFGEWRPAGEEVHPWGRFARRGMGNDGMI
ncbi:hypothetical protein F5B19DRAFT_55761 [Rostrohypoxylon terebratum]|nr:hypothetical protein F5B19DRAFT_55761 [Rostrohypoxylon terebratum]